MRDITLLLFFMACGLTVSGIVANTYRLLMPATPDAMSRTSYWIVIGVAGPTIMIGNATRSFRAKKFALAGYLMAVSACLYWAFIIGLFTTSVALAI